MRCIRPQQVDPLAIIEHRDVVSVNIQPQPQFQMSDAKMSKVGLEVIVWNKFLLTHKLAIHHKV